jgi:HEAT repeat protein
MINRISKAKSDKTSAKASQPSAPSRESSPKTSAATRQLEQLRTGDWSVRSAAALELGKLGDRQATSALSAALRDPSAEVAKSAAVALGALHDVSAVEALAAVVLNGDGYFHSTVRVAAAEALAALRDRRAVVALIAGVRDQIAEVSQASIEALGTLGDERAIDSLVVAVRNDHNYFLAFVRQSAVQALSRLSVPSARESLRHIAADTYLDSSVRQAASKAVAVAHSIN